MALNKRKYLSTDEKIKIIQQYDALANKNQRIASKELGISQPSLCKILKHRQDIMNLKSSNINSSFKRHRSGNDPEIEIALLNWFKFASDKVLPLVAKS